MAWSFHRTVIYLPLKLGATDLDAILLETHSFVDAANGPEDSGWETVKVTIDGQTSRFRTYRLRAASCFQTKFSGSLTRQQAGKPISSVTIDLGDSLRRVSVSGESADKVDALSKLLEKDFVATQLLLVARNSVV